MEQLELDLFAAPAAGELEVPVQVWLVQRRAGYAAPVEFLGLYRTRRGAQEAADEHNRGFDGPRQFGAQVRALPAAWLDQVPGGPDVTEVQP